ncbi:MAG: 8-oxo-dGTP diphosphatase [Halobaculum sp.]
MDEATVCYPITDGETLLIRKQRGVGAGKLVGPGGRVEPDETPDDCVRREVREELRVEPVGVERVGEIEFHFRTPDPDDDSMYVYVYTAEGVRGEPEATPEAVPVWHPTDQLPYEEMWADDRIWMPHMLDGHTFTGQFVLTDDGEALAEYSVTLDVSV